MIKSFILKTKQLSENQLFVTSQSAVTFGLVATAAAGCLFESMPLPGVGLDPAKLGGVLGTSTTPVPARVRVRCLISPRLLPPPTSADTLEY